MKIGMKEKTIKDLAEVNKQLKVGTLEYIDDVLNKIRAKRTSEFKVRKTIVIKPAIEGENVNLVFELRGNNEIIAIGGVEEILNFFELDIVSPIERGYTLGVKKEDGFRRNPKSCKYFLDVCTYKREDIKVLKRHLDLSQEEDVYFYRPEIFLLNEKETIERLKCNAHYNKYNQFIKHTIKRQHLFHGIFNTQYNLNYIKVEAEDGTEESLKLELRDKNNSMIFDSIEEISNFLETGSLTSDTEKEVVRNNINEDYDDTTKSLEAQNYEQKKERRIYEFLNIPQKINSNLFNLLKVKTKVS